LVGNLGEQGDHVTDAHFISLPLYLDLKRKGDAFRNPSISGLPPHKAPNYREGQFGRRERLGILPFF
jgi:hypothetical protein